MIVYNGLFSHKDIFSGCGAILYSTLVSHSIWSYGEFFDSYGELDMDAVNEHLDECKDENGVSYIELPYYTYSTLSSTLEMTERNVRYIIKDLQEGKYIVDDGIYCSKWLINSGYTKIVKGTTLKGWQLVFYSLLKDRANYFGGSIDTWASRLAKLFSTTTNNVYFLISTLKKKGYVYRAKNGRLVVR